MVFLNMEEEEAFELLELEKPTSEREIKDRYRELSHQSHPDSEGSHEEMERLNIAKEIALESIDREIVTKDSLEKSIQYSAQKEQRRKESEKTVEKLINRGTSRYRRFRQMTLLFGGSLVVSVTLIRFVGNTLFPDGSLLYFLLFSILVMMYSYLFHISMKNIELMIEEADEALTDKMQFIYLLEDIGYNYQDDPVFTEKALEDKVRDWIGGSSTTSFFLTGLLGSELDYKSLAQHVGPADFSRLVIRKGLEKELLAEVETIDEEGWMVRYELNTPSKNDS